MSAWLERWLAHLVRYLGRQIYAVAFALDILACSVCGGAAGETFSARFWQNREGWGAGWMMFTDDMAYLLTGVVGHCQIAWNDYQARAKAAPFGQ